MTSSTTRMTNAYPVRRLSYSDCSFCASLFETRLATRAGIACGSDSRSRQTYCDRNAAGDGPELKNDTFNLPTRAEPGGVVELGGQPHFAGHSGQHICGDRDDHLGLDEAVERRRGAKIKARGIYRYPVRSRRSHFVKAGRLRGLGAARLVPIP